MQKKVAIVTGGDSGIGRAVAIAFAKEGADLVIPYLNEHQDAAETKQIIGNLGRNCLPIAVDLREEDACRYVVETTVTTFGRLDVRAVSPKQYNGYYERTADEYVPIQYYFFF